LRDSCRRRAENSFLPARTVGGVGWLRGSLATGIRTRMSRYHTMETLAKKRYGPDNTCCGVTEDQTQMNSESGPNKAFLHELGALKERIEDLEKKGHALPLPDSDEFAELHRVKERLERVVAERTFQAQLYLDLAAVMFIALDRDGRITMMNRKGCEILGCDPSSCSAVGKPWFDTYLPDRMKTQVRVVFDRLMAGEVVSAEYYENPIVNASGDERLIAWHNTVLKDREGNITGTISSGEDITERRMAEEAIRESEARFRSLLEQTSDAIFCYEYDPPIPTGMPAGEQVKKLYDGVLVECNETCAKAYGAEAPGEVVGKRLRELFGAERESVDSLFRAMIEGGYRVVDGEGVEEMPDGTKRYFLNNAHGIAENGKLVRIWGTFRDVTEARQAEFALRESRERLSQFMDAASDLFFLLDKDLRLLEVNRRGLEIIGRRRDEVLGRHMRDLVPDAESSGRQAKYMHVLETGEPFTIDHFVPHPVFGDRNFILTAFKVGDGLGVIGTDFTERRRAQENLEEAFEEISRLKEQLEAENIYLREEVRLSHLHGDIVAQSDVMKSIMSQAEKVAPTDSTVLIMGETGTGKELLARAIHNMSSRSKRPLVVVNCAAMPAALVESELFGREKGAYTGAITRQAGRFEIADGSTIFLDEIGELTPEVQAKLLRVLQEGRFERLGSGDSIDVNVRVIAATNRDLEKDVDDGIFRRDLFYRLNVFPITIAPLREREEDIPALVWSLVNELSERIGKRIESISQASMDALRKHSWPGNVRELRNVIEQAMIRANESTLRIQIPSRTVPGMAAKGRTLAEVEKQYITEVLERAGWRVRGKGGAAELLGLKPTTLDARMKKLGVRRPR